MRRATVPVLGAAISALLSSGLTAVWLRGREPDTLAVRAPFDVVPEQRALASLLVAPGGAYVPVSSGREVRIEGRAELGFSRGWSRQWRAPDGDVVEAIVLEFGSADGALGYARGAGRAVTLLAKPRPFAVSGIPGASGLTDTMADRDGRYARVVVMHRGTRAAVLVFTEHEPAPGPAIGALARRQYAALAL